MIDKALGGRLSPARSVLAIGGLEAAVDGMRAMDDRWAVRGQGPHLPQVPGLPLTAVDELARTDPEIAARLGPGGVWTAAAEPALLERYWTP